MECPTKENVLAAAKVTPEIKEALQKLFPEYFEKYIQPGEIYSWRKSSGAGAGNECGLVISHKDEYILVNFLSGKEYLVGLSKNMTKSDLNDFLKRVNRILDVPEDIKLKGPFKFNSWTWKETQDG